MAVDKGTVIRTIALVITWVNMILANHGFETIPAVSDETIATILAGIVTVWSWFKNNYVTYRGLKQKEELQKKGLAK